MTSLAALLLGAVSVLILTVGFYQNYWSAVEANRYEESKHKMNFIIFGRLAKSRQDGLLSAGALNGTVEYPHGDMEGVRYQHEAYTTGAVVKEFYPYRSQIGFQGMIFGFLDKITHFSPERTIDFLLLASAILSAVALSLIVLWFYTEFGLFTACIVLVTTAYSEWLTLFGQSLWWSTWAFYLPFLSLVLLLRADSKRYAPYSISLLSLVVFASMFAKTLFNGYELISTTFIMLLIPYVYYGLRESWPANRFSLRLVTAAVSAIGSILLSLAVANLQSYLANPSRGESSGFRHLWRRFLTRTYGDRGINRADVDSSVMESWYADVLVVIRKHLEATAFDLNHLLRCCDNAEGYPVNEFFHVSFAELIILFIAVSLLALLLLWTHREVEKVRRKTLALLSTTWLSMMAPLSWFIVFRDHAYLHEFTSVVWHMPFTIFGFGLFGFVLQHLILLQGRKPLHLLDPGT